ncbi:MULTISPECIES: P-loop NTPase [unclassified Microbacterium]|uniref:AAA family ATPase n=1 Tax=unclassified Microbacterium TaxID=2609290 RepID=UPI0012FBDA32|nr:P-loop NTPase [Microbacterium sp. MAH-37]MVQ41778.1 P-loop NTPase [Microbacterium sp. MAH-37]
MTAVVVALADEERGGALAAELDLEEVTVLAVCAPDAIDPADLQAADALVITPSRRWITRELVTACDRAAVRIVPFGDGEERLLAKLGLAPSLPDDTPGWRIADALAADRPTAGTEAADAAPSRLIAVWGPHGAPGRTTLAIQLAVELARTGRRTALLDADTTAPSIALLLGLGDEAPGLAAACRRAELGSLDSAELSRLAVSLETSAGPVDVLGGLNRPSRWPELGAARMRGALTACRAWAEEIVVDVSASFEEEDDDYDLAAPSRHAATATALREADAVIALTSADPVGVSRFVRGYAELRHLVGPTPITVVANSVRPGPLGIDARGQIRRTLDRFAGIDDVQFLPHDQRAADAALLHARPIADVLPRSPLVAAVRRLAAGLSPRETGVREPATAGSSRGSSRGALRPR